LSASTGNFIVDLLVWTNIYGIYLLLAFFPASYYIWLRIFSFPLITRRSHEILLVLTPEKLKIKKIKSRLNPFFKFAKGLYWFNSPFDDVNSNNQFHIYIEGINQSLSTMDKDGTLKRREGKLNELTSNTEKINEITSHKIVFPKDIKGHMHRHYLITIDPFNRKYKLTPTDKAQNLRYSFYHTVGFVLQTEIEDTEENQNIESTTIQHETDNLVEVETNSGNQKLVLTAITTQLILNKIKFLQEYKYFSSYSAYNLHRKIRRLNTNFVRWILGSIDPRLIILLIVVLGGIALVYFGMPLLTPKLGPMPT